MSTRNAIVAGVAAVLLLGAGAAGWTLRGWQADARIAALVAQHATVMQGYADAAYQASERARTEEQRRIDAVEESAHETDRLLAQAVATERAAADRRVRQLADDYASSYRGMAERATATAEREAASTAIGMFAQLLSRTDDLAGIYAAYADRSQVAGMGCEAAYDAMRGPR